MARSLLLDGRQTLLASLPDVDQEQDRSWGLSTGGDNTGEAWGRSSHSVPDLIPGVAVIYVSGAFDQEAVRNEFPEERATFLQKPVDAERLVECMRRQQGIVSIRPRSARL